jgi:hypothetical protein
MRVRRVVTGIVAGLALSGVPRLEIAEEPLKVQPRPVPVHADAAEFENAFIDTIRAFVRSDLGAARAALDRMEAGCRRLESDEASPYPQSVVDVDRAFHSTLDKAREYAIKGHEDRAFEQLYWIEKACRMCHDVGRTEKLPGLPAPRAAVPPGASTPGAR